MRELRRIGEDKILQILDVKASFPVFDDFMYILYMRREGLSTKEICSILHADYNQIYRLISKLIHLEILKEKQNKFILSQKGIDIYKCLSNSDFDASFLNAIRKKHSITILKMLENGKRSWKDLYRGTRISQSSMKNVLDALIDAGLVVREKQGEYSITDDGRSILNAIKRMSDMHFTPGFEIQAKFSVNLSDFSRLYDIISDMIEAEEDVRQSDYYIRPVRWYDTSYTYLRYREEIPLKHSLKRTPSHILTWTRLIDKRKYGNVWILNREREEMNVEHPSIVFFLEFLNAELEKKIVKRRKKIEAEEAIMINIDNIEEPHIRDVTFVEIKANAWDYDESVGKAEVINQIMSDISEKVRTKSMSKSYFEAIQSGIITSYR